MAGADQRRPRPMLNVVMSGSLPSPTVQVRQPPRRVRPPMECGACRGTGKIRRDGTSRFGIGKYAGYDRCLNCNGTGAA